MKATMQLVCKGAVSFFRVAEVGIAPSETRQCDLDERLEVAWTDYARSKMWPPKFACLSVHLLNSLPDGELVFWLRKNGAVVQDVLHVAALQPRGWFSSDLLAVAFADGDTFGLDASNISSAVVPVLEGFVIFLW